jgi:hypothetical protein
VPSGEPVWSKNSDSPGCLRRSSPKPPEVFCANAAKHLCQKISADFGAVIIIAVHAVSVTYVGLNPNGIKLTQVATYRQFML